MQSDLNLEPIEQRAGAATAGPWGCDGEEIAPLMPDSSLDWSNEIGVIISHEQDGHFVAHARTDVPALIAEVKRLRAIRDAARAHIKDWYSSDTMAHKTRAVLRDLLGIKI